MDEIYTCTPEQLAQRKHVFETVIVNELMAEMKFLFDIQAERATRRKNFKDKAKDAVMTVSKAGLSAISMGSKMIPHPAGEMAVRGISTALLAGLAVGDKLITSKISSNEAKALEETSEFFYGQEYEHYKIYFREVAKLASLRYEFILACVSDDLNKGVVPLARIGARRAITYLRTLQHQLEEALKKAQKGELSEEERDRLKAKLQVSLASYLLEGVTNGKSGSGYDGFKNHKIQSKKQANEDKGSIVDKMTNKAVEALELVHIGQGRLSVESILNRAAVRVMPKLNKNSNLAQWPIYYREKDKNKRISGTEQVKRNVEGDSVCYPRNGYMLLFTEESRTSGQYTESYTAQAVQFYDKERPFYPSVYIATGKEVEAYLKKVVIIQETNHHRKKVKPILSFKEYLVEGVKKLDQGKAIQTVWVRDDFSGKTLAGGDFSYIDFSGCCFNNTKLKDMKLESANLSFVEAKQLTCENVGFVKACWDGADLANAKFINSPCTAASWVGANLVNFDPNKEIEKIQKVQNEQKKEFSKSQKKLVKQHTEVTKFIETQKEQIHLLTSYLTDLEDKVDEELRSFMEKAVIDYQKALQLKLDVLAFKAYCEEQFATVNKQQTYMTQENTKQQIALTEIEEHIKIIDPELKKINQAFEELYPKGMAKIGIGIGATIEAKFTIENNHIRLLDILNEKNRIEFAQKTLDKIQNGLQLNLGILNDALIKKGASGRATGNSVELVSSNNKTTLFTDNNLPKKLAKRFWVKAKDKLTALGADSEKQQDVCQQLLSKLFASRDYANFQEYYERIDENIKMNLEKSFVEKAIENLPTNNTIDSDHVQQAFEDTLRELQAEIKSFSNTFSSKKRNYSQIN